MSIIVIGTGYIGNYFKKIIFYIQTKIYISKEKFIYKNVPHEKYQRNFHWNNLRHCS